MASPIYGPTEFTAPQRELPLGFSFRVKLGEGSSFGFQSISGLSREVTTESFREGGQLYDYALPIKVQYGELVLKRGLWLHGKDEVEEIHQWLTFHQSNLLIQKKDITIELVRPWNNQDRKTSADGISVYYTWKIRNAWPKKWTISDFNAEESELIIETLELHYDEFEVLAP